MGGDMDAEPLRAEIARVMAAEPNLSAYGFRYRSRTTCWNDGEQFERERELMRTEEFAEQVAVCRDWLHVHPIPKRSGSYSLKHVIESDARCYVTNGAAIVAALLAGYEAVRELTDGPNCGFRRPRSARPTRRAA